MEKEKVLTRLTDTGVVGVVRASSGDEAKRISEACLEGGVDAIELTFTVPGAHKVIEELAAYYKNGEMLLGAGTVLDPETARIAILSGAQYIVSPYFDPETIKLCNRYRLPGMPGCVSIKEVVNAMEAGADIIKVFPGELFGPKIIKSIKGPLPHAKLMPTGGVSIDNVDEWIKAGSAAVGVGGALTAGAKTGDYKSITDMARRLVEKVRQTRDELNMP